jgi:outer membrane murein-binding lipoprotein Lpp
MILNFNDYILLENVDAEIKLHSKDNLLNEGVFDKIKQLKRKLKGEKEPKKKNWLSSQIAKLNVKLKTARLTKMEFDLKKLQATSKKMGSKYQKQYKTEINTLKSNISNLKKDIKTTNNDT